MSRTNERGMRELSEKERKLDRPRYLEMFAIAPFPLVVPGDDLREVLRQGIAASELTIRDADILVLTHKVISRSEGRLVHLDIIVPSAKALHLARKTNKDPRVVELILRETKELVRVRGGHIITEHWLGHISANAGVDRSNSAKGDVVCLLPSDPDAVASQICAFIQDEYEKRVAVLISDSHGRPFRKGTVGTCIGVYGLSPLFDLRGQEDLFHYTLERSTECVADELCAAANLLMGQASEGVPVVLIRGISWHASGASIREVLRSPEEDIFRSGSEGVENGYDPREQM